MAFDSGSITFKRFFVQGQGPKQVDEALLEKLAAKAVGADSIQTADHSEIGWATGDHILDTSSTSPRTRSPTGCTSPCGSTPTSRRANWSAATRRSTSRPCCRPPDVTSCPRPSAARPASRPFRGSTPRPRAARSAG